MAISSVLHLIPKFLLLIIISINNNTERNGLILSSAQLLVKPLWEYVANVTYPCFANTNGGVAFFSGSSGHSCSLQVAAPKGTHIQLQAQGSVVNLEESFMYVDLLNDADHCRNKYIVFNDISEQCIAFIPQRNMTIVLQGVFSMSINDRQVTGTSQRCPNFDKDIIGVNQSSTCKKVQLYDNKLTCWSLIFYFGNRCRIQFRTICDTILGPREVIYQCNDHNSAQNRRILIAYEIDVVSLDLASNHLVRINDNSFQGLKGIQSLDLHMNQITSMTSGALQGLSKLKTLSLYQNRLSTLSEELFQDLTNLESLNLYNNRITNLNAGLFQSLRKLKSLLLSRNKLNTLPDGIFQGLTNLDTLMLDSNQLSKLNAGLFQGLRKLTDLYLNYNMLKSLPERIFQDLINLDTLNLGFNLITKLDAECFHGLSMLKSLFLNDNMLNTLPKAIFPGLTNLEYLHLGPNQITQLNPEWFQSLSILKELTLSGNMLSTLPMETFVHLTTLQVLSLDQNRIDQLNALFFQGMTNLKSIYLNENMLQYLTDGVFHNLTNLEDLNLGSNQINKLNVGLFRGLGRLAYLILGGNMLSTLPERIFWNLTNLDSLNLASNQITFINTALFRDLSKLEFLHLGGNMLSSFPEGIFQNLSNLQVLDLSHNWIVKLDLSIMIGLKRLQKVFLFNTMMQEWYVPQSVYENWRNAWFFSLSVYFNQLPDDNSTLDWNILNGLTNLLYLEFGISDVNLLPKALKNKASLPSLALTHMSKLVRLNPGLFLDLHGLERLTISQNNLVELTNGVFDGLSDLKFLYAEENQLKHLDNDVFEGLVGLLWISFRDNHLTQVDLSIFNNTVHLVFLDLSYNRIKDIAGDKLTYALVFHLFNNPLNLITPNSLSSLTEYSELIVSQHEVCECYVPSNVTCGARDARSPYLTCDRLLSDKALVVVMWLIGLNALIGNFFVLVWRNRGTPTNTVNSKLLSSLALSDFLMGIYMLIIASADIHFGDHFPILSENWRSSITCRIAGALSIISSEASVFFVTLISIDRFICIRFPYSTRHMTAKSVVKLAILTWIFSLVLGIVPSVLAGRSFKFYDNSHVCIGLPLALTKIYTSTSRLDPYVIAGNPYYIQPNIDYNTELVALADGLYFSTAVFLGLNCVCYLVILACYIEIVRAVFKSRKSAGRSRDMSEQIRLTLKVTAIVATDFCCWFPVIVLGILVQTRVITLPPSVYAWCVTFVLPINSAINPYLYTISDLISTWRKKRVENKTKLEMTLSSKTANSLPVENADQSKPTTVTPAMTIKTISSSVVSQAVSESREVDNTSV
ncbi:LOW QUALITY PROTEIN: uncharacterized protein [Amphiura filiformis]|uniref:LOW QUALITY PROTEIN: uncharacterized protein n=1 Tax=Amphiura filiformis TaxID=82378 RepID=UPI003B20B9BC